LHAFDEEFRLGNRSGKRWPDVDKGGAYLGEGSPLLQRVPSGLGHKWIVRPEIELERLFSEAFHKPNVDVGDLARNLRAVANALNKGDMSLAAIALVLARIPALPEVAAKYDPNEPRVPAGQPDGGEWSAEDPSAGNAPASDVLEAGFSGPALQLFRIIRDAVQNGRISPELIANIVAEFAANIPGSEIPVDIVTAFNAPQTLEQMQTSKPPASFATASALSAYLGPAPPGYEWHHIVEQSAIGVFSADSSIAWEINSTDNVVLIPKVYHLLITADMNTDGLRAMVQEHDFAAQRQIGLYLLRKWGALQ
jgi:hypothetical protein